MGLLRWYRATGADLPFGHPMRAHHGVSMEGYFWRIADPNTGRVVIALCGANEGPNGPWATIGLGTWPSGFLRTEALSGAWTDPGRLGVKGGIGAMASPDVSANIATFEADSDQLHVDLGSDAQLNLRFHDREPWPHRVFGGSSLFQMVPGLIQYWHPWLLGGKASGTAILGDSTWEFRNADVYAEKNWGQEGFPESWW